MPTYQYRCTECDHAFEQFQSFTDDALTVCPACGGRLRKVFNAVGVVFKGSGFYRTDSRGSSATDGGSGSKSGGDSGSDSGSSKGSDS
ncbi:MAG TPA: FmdB family zinc ribbon protein, partial [Nocardioides sp.]|nr:FmdB family zinc ribbon protein [Nocardioides sp.]